MKKYWKSLEELKDIKAGSDANSTVGPEFPVEGLTTEEVKSGFKSNRRDFLKMLGFTVGYATLASSCEQPVRKAIPYLAKPEEVIPGQANHYASTFFNGHDYCSVLVKVRDGRPIKIEGNDLSSITKGGTSARVQASVLSLYDGARFQHPLRNGEKTDWVTADAEIMEQLSKIAARNGKIRILSESVISPSTKRVFEDFISKYPGTEVVYYDSISYNAMKKANELTFGRDAIPSYEFNKAEVIVGFNADFLGNWLSPIEFSRQYAETRDLSNGKMSKHYQFESYMSLTGSNADVRIPIKPSEEKVVLLNLYNKIAAASDGPPINVEHSPVDIDKVAEDLMHHQGKGVVISGTNDIYIQGIVNAINFLLGNLGGTFNFEKTLLTKQGNDAAVKNLVTEMNNGQVDALLVYNANPAYDYFKADEFKSGMAKVGLTISLADASNETAKLATYVCPDHHYLESWNDAEAYSKQYSLSQPTINPLFETRQAQESLLKWAGIEFDYHTYIQKYWEENFFALQSEYLTFTDFWNHTLQKGVFELEPETLACPLFNFDFLESNMSKFAEIKKATGIELVLYEKIGLGNGKQANNPWLQELPDPISKAVWDNYVAISPNFAKENGLALEDVVKINGIELPVLIQPGQPIGTVSVALGYGRTDTGKVANGIGKNVFGMVSFFNDTFQYNASVSIEKTGETYSLATTQTHHSMEGRPIVRETVLDQWKEHPESGNEFHRINEEKAVTLYKKPHYEGFHWGLGIDLNKCVGCSACVVACQAENNVAVIGKEEVKNSRIMHWIRVDRYYSVVEDKIGADIESENPEVVHQPVMCQHCDNAPCENVCPVAATPHSKEGLNQMAYNRCIGTRYCMNNCPYRVRRFNWYRYLDNDKFDYNFNDEISKMVLNPDVVVRERGVVEKCSMCVQRIQEKKLVAKKESRIPYDGEIQPACVQSCPTQALVFGDMNDKNSKVSKVKADPRTYNLLEEIHTLSSVGYMTKVRNKPAEHSHDDGHTHS
jgi:molybdopterin-containing oxidoreductase family iron-sulfur binding subunit